MIKIFHEEQCSRQTYLRGLQNRRGRKLQWKLNDNGHVLDTRSGRRNNL
jgi:hypothetical protein